GRSGMEDPLRFIIPASISALIFIILTGLACFFYWRKHEKRDNFKNKLINRLCCCCIHTSAKFRKYSSSSDELGTLEKTEKRIKNTTNTPTMPKQCPGCTCTQCPQQCSENQCIHPFQR
ncbi:unnamed protein product, partial [Owenia fusiformis]